MLGIYGIFDTNAKAFLGGLQLFRHDAPAVRFFADVASDPQTMIARHPADYELLCLGRLSDDPALIEGFETPQVVITGAAWKAAQAAQEAANNG